MNPRFPFTFVDVFTITSTCDGPSSLMLNRLGLERISFIAPRISLLSPKIRSNPKEEGAVERVKEVPAAHSKNWAES